MKFSTDRQPYVFLCAGLFAVISGAMVVNAATFQVSNVANDGAGSLRQAISDANAAAGAPHTVVFSTAAGSPFLAAGRTVIRVSGILSINTSVTLQGSANGVILDGAAASQLLNIAAGVNVTLQDLTLANGTIRAGAATGGAVINRGNLTFHGCTLRGNNSLGGGATGGAIQQISGNLALLNSTVAGNSCISNSNGGAIYVAGGNLAVTHCTFQGNTPDAIHVHDGSASVANSIFTNNNGSNLEGSVTYGGANIINGAAGTVLGSGTISTAEPLLQPLANQGGPTDVHELYLASPAIHSGVGSIATAAGLTSDQRGSGFSRSVGSSVDIGAVESGGNFLSLTLAATSLVENGPAAVATLTRSGSTTTALTVSLTSSVLTAATVPASVVIPAGMSSVNFAVTPVNDALLDATQTSLISAMAVGCPAATAALSAVTVSVASEDQGLTVTILDRLIPENTGLTTATVTRFGLDFSSPLTVALASSTRVSHPASIILPADAVSFTLPITAVDNAVVDSFGTVLITATAVGHIPGSMSMTLLDDDVLVQRWMVDSVADENDGIITPGNRSLREAIAAANGFGGKTRLTFSTLPGSPFSAFTPARITLSLGELLITGDVTIEGPVQGVIIDGGGRSRVINVDSRNARDGNRGVELSKIFITGGLATVAGGGIRNVEALRLVDGSITGCGTSSLTTSGCGLQNEGSAQLDRYTISGNGPTGYSAQGSGIFNSGTLTLSCSTLVANKGKNDSPGGGLRNTGLAALTHVTVAFNFVNGSNSGGSGISNSGNLSLANSIVSNNFGGSSGELAGNFTKYGVNIVRNAQSGVVPTGPGSVLTLDPQLLGLGSNGGLTQTARLALTSPAIDAGDDAVAITAGISYDQRGEFFLRTVGSHVDLGAYEENFKNLTLTFATTEIYEGATVLATVTRSGGSLGPPAVISLTSLDTTEATVPASITIPAGQASVTFTVTMLDDGLLDGDQPVQIQVSGMTQGTWSSSLTVLDAAQFFTLSVFPETILENGGVLTGTTTGTVKRAPFTVGAVTVSLTSSDVTAAVVPASVVIPDGAQTASFPITAVDDAFLESVQAVTITASSAGFTSGTRAVNVASDETDSLVVDLANDVEDGNTTPGNVSLREAIALAVQNTAHPSLITFSTAAGSPFNGAGRATILLLNTLNISSSLTIRAPASGVILDRGNGGRLMNTQGSGNFIRLENLTLKNGNYSAGGATGGGIQNGSNLVISSCTFTGNSANGGGATGGAIYQSNGTLGIYNSTFTGNSCTLNGNGGGIYLQSGITRIVHSTLTGNIPDGVSGGSNSKLTVINSIFHDNNASSIEGSYIQEGVNIITGGAGSPTGSGTLLTTDPRLGPLANNGGPCDTFLLGTGSPALDAGLASGAAGLALDQRGLPRLSGSAVDLGSVEIQVGDLTYANWAAGYFSPGTAAVIQAFDADADHDGLSNGLEFYFGSDPTLSAPSPLTFTRDTAAGLMRISYPHLTASRLTSAEPQISSDLVLWSGSGVTFGPTTAIDSTHERLEALVPLGTVSKQFFRVKLTP